MTDSQSLRGAVLFTPDEAAIKASELTRYATFLQETRGKRFTEYSALHEWSIREGEDFWRSLAEFFDVLFTRRGDSVLTSRRMPGARWFSGYELNYAEHALRHEEGIAIVYRTEAGERVALSYDELREQVARVRAGLLAFGVEAGDRVVGYLGNRPEAAVALLATASLGAIWSSCPPEFGVESVLERFRQIEPKVLITAPRYSHGGKRFDRAVELEQIRAGLPTLERTVVVDAPVPQGASSWEQLGERLEELRFQPVPFEHPLWILYSSGTTGQPKAIVHGHGGIVLEHYKVLSLHSDLTHKDRFFWYSTTGWMMWNYLVSGLLLGATVVLYEGSPAYPDLSALWQLAAEEEVSYFGTSAPFLMSCRARGVKPAQGRDLSRLRAVGSTGAPLPSEGFHWVYEQVSSRVHLGSVSGGTDVCSAFVLACPWRAVRAGELQCAGLGADVQAFSETGQRLFGEVGELVLCTPMPSMPLYFWNDDGGDRLRESYFSRFDGVWCHGDWIRQFEDGACVIYGRSDATLNRGGVRMGTSEFYRVVQSVEGVRDSLVVDTGALDQPGELWLFVDALPETAKQQAALAAMLRHQLRTRLSPRHSPDVVCFVPEIPYTLSGKKLEIPVKRALSGQALDRVVNWGTLKNPEAMRTLLEHAEAMKKERQASS